MSIASANVLTDVLVRQLPLDGGTVVIQHCQFQTHDMGPFH